MIQMPNHLSFTTIVLLMGLTGLARAHGDADLPLFIAEHGVNTGDCLDESNPCGSIAYTLSRAGKGSQIRIAKGTYAVNSPEDVFHLVSGVIDVSGGYIFGDKTGLQPAGESILTGIPFEYRELLKDRGIRVIQDQKGIDQEPARAAGKLLDLHRQLKSSLPATPCEEGTAAGLPCANVDLLSHVGFNDVSADPISANDIWGFVDLNTGREYAIVGFNLGTGVFDVTDPTNPREVGFVDGQSATWRDIKVYQHYDSIAGRWNAYAYVTTDGSSDGLFVIDMTTLPHAISRVSYASDIIAAHNVYAANADYSTGISITGNRPTIVIAGSSRGVGEYRAYSLIDPRAPAFIAGGTGIGYMHDASSIIINDARKDTQCVNALDYCEVLIDFNENMVEIWDVTNPASPVQLSATEYPNAAYVHSGWWSEDKQTIYVHDELDERDGGLATTVYAFDVSDLRSPVALPGWSGPTDAIDHNGFVRGNRYYMSNYTRGLTILDISNPGSPVAAGRLDTYPSSDGTMFSGTWGTYPFFWSGNVAINDIDSGFYMAADRTRNVDEGMIQFAETSFAGDEGQVIPLVVERANGSTGAVEVSYEILHATADAADYTLSTGALSWGVGDATNRSIDIEPANDGVSEPMERLLVRLINPTNGATLGDHNVASAWISDPGSTAELNFGETTATLTERGFATVVAVVHRGNSGVGAASVDLTVGGNAIAGDDYTGIVPATLNWADGDANPKFVEISIVDDGFGEGDETFTLTMNNPTGAITGAADKFTATIQDSNGTNIAPNAIAGSDQTRPARSTVQLNGTQSEDPNGDNLDFQWRQTMGTSVTLTNAETSIATFTAPNITSDTLLRFELTVTDPGGLSDTATTTVTVTAPPPAASSGGGSIDGLTVLTLLALLATRLRRRDLV